MLTTPHVPGYGAQRLIVIPLLLRFHRPNLFGTSLLMSDAIGLCVITGGQTGNTLLHLHDIVAPRQWRPKGRAGARGAGSTCEVFSPEEQFEADVVK